MAVVGGGLAITLAILGAADQRFLAAVALIGFLVALSTFIVTEASFTAINRGTAGVLLMACAVFPRVKNGPGPVAH